MKYLLYTVIFISTIALSSAVDLLCDFKWPRCGLTVENTVCNRDEKCQPEPGCEDVQPDPEFLKFILHEHNRLRKNVASGAESRGFTGVAANMMAISYDKDLEYTARCHINRCKFEHDKCRGTKKFPLAGQNLYYTSESQEALKNAVNEWYEEINQMTPDVIDSFPRGRHDIGHFSQSMWAKTTHVGCALSKSLPTAEDDEVKYYIACNYGPIGNMIGKTVYERGAGCSKCPDGVACNAEFPALCGEVDESQIYAKTSSGEDILNAGVSDSANVTVGVSSKTSVTVSGDTEADSESKDGATNAATKANSNGVTLTISNVNTRTTVVAGQDTSNNATLITANATEVPKVLGTNKNCTCASNINVASLTFILSIYLALFVLIE
ncbi:venom allergen 5-like isoform X2 [Diabrotica undecimpunctata]|uniref:venom allergen 5-like isoform X2 n=1 Tax=Diabrotica undecimpunctata TaxID=50387 RepID=UPI003B63F216